MTCRNAFYASHANMEHEQAIELFKKSCPDDFGYARRPEYCFGSNRDCMACWERQCEKNITYEDIADILKKGCEDDMVYAHTEYAGENNQSTSRPIIKDSGNRREFESGAVRDMQEGKGRCDLMPLEVAGKWLKDDILNCIAQFKSQGDTTFLYGALNYFLDTAGWSYYEALLEVAKHFEEGAKKYSEDNWKRGIPPKCYIDSAVRHYLKYMRGDKDEPHDRAFIWNLMCCIWEVDYHSEVEEN